jgi:pimeloyl-ACP methyl ester carboxylesterase
MNVSVFQREGLRLALHQGGTGLPFVFQHGLGGNAAQTRDLLPDDAGFERITLECRGHGASDCGPHERLSMAHFAEDIIALIEALALGPIALGGVSMGAAIASRIAVKRPDLVSKLVLVRPAWIAEAAPVNLALNRLVGSLLKHHPPEVAGKAFEEHPDVRRLATLSPDNLASLRGFFASPDPEKTSALLLRISNDGPGVDRSDIARIKSPALVLGCADDIIHPLSMAEELAGLLPQGRFVAVHPKGHDRVRHAAEVKAAVRAFLLPAQAGCG